MAVADGGLESRKSALPLEGGGGMAQKRNLSAPVGAFAKKQWKTAVWKAKSLPDPWEGWVYYGETLQLRITAKNIKLHVPSKCLYSIFLWSEAFFAPALWGVST